MQIFYHYQIVMSIFHYYKTKIDYFCKPQQTNQLMFVFIRLK